MLNDSFRMNDVYNTASHDALRFINAGKIKEASSKVLRLMKAGYKSASFYNTLGLVELLSDNHSEASERFVRALMSFDSNMPDEKLQRGIIFYNLSVAYLRMGENFDILAEQACKKALELGFYEHYASQKKSVRC